MAVLSPDEVGPPTQTFSADEVSPPKSFSASEVGPLSATFSADEVSPPLQPEIHDSDGNLIGGSMAEPSAYDLLKEAVKGTTEPFVQIPRPTVSKDDSAFVRFGKGLTQSASGVVEGIETPLGVATVAASALPVVGPIIGRTAAAGFGIKTTLEGFKEAAEAYQQGDIEKAGRAVGSLMVGGAMVRGSVGVNLKADDLAKPSKSTLSDIAEVAPATAEALKGVIKDTTALKPATSTPLKGEIGIGELPTFYQVAREGKVSPYRSERARYDSGTFLTSDRAFAQQYAGEKGTVSEIQASPEHILNRGTIEGEQIYKDALNQSVKEGNEGNSKTVVEILQSQGYDAIYNPKLTRSGPGLTIVPTNELNVFKQEHAKLASDPSISNVTPPELPPESAGRLARAWQGIRTALETSPVKEDMAAHMDAAENMAKVSGAQAGNRVRLMVPDKLDQQAITFLIEADGDLAKLNEFATKVESDPKAVKAVERAISDFDRLQPIAEQSAKIMDDQIVFEQAHGTDTDFTEGYIKHAYDQAMLMGRGRPVILGGGGGTGSTAFKKQRTFATYADAIAAGFKPKTLDAAALIDSRVAAGTRLVNRMEWGNALRSVVDPTSNKPIVTSLVKQPKGTEVAPMGYEPREILPGMRVAVHEGYGKLFDAITGASRIGELEVAGLPVGQALLKGTGFIKHGLLAFDTFHASRIMQKQLFLTGKVGWKNGKTLLDYSDADLASAVDQKLITQEMADSAHQMRPDAELLLKEGLNVGRIQEALYAATVSKLPIIGTFNKWVFDKVTRGAMLESGLRELDRVHAAYPDITRQEAARIVSHDLNFYFGNISRQGLFKSATFQDMARLVALAPQWVESMAQTEARAAAQLAKAPFTGKVGTLGKGVGQGLLAYFVGTQLLNLATRHQFTWDNPEKDHKMDAWIPDAFGKTDGFFISPFSVVAELTHDLIRYNASKGSILDAAGQIASNKLSPMARAEEIMRTGRDYSGTKILGTWNRIKEAAWAVAPTPIPLQPAFRNAPPGQVERQMLGSAGFKVEPNRAAFQDIVGRFKITSREGFEGYLNSLAKEARVLPKDKQMQFVDQRLREDQVAPRYLKEAQTKMHTKLARQK